MITMFPWELFWEAAWRIGFPFILVCLFGYGLLKRHFVTGGEYLAMLKVLTEQIEQERKSSDDSLRRERERSAELWDLIRPSIGLARGALDKIEGGRTGTRR